ncbi:unnamed protein product [Chrysodeixis includens]|uniref:Uncharacterized protein n=1 Tax=Chrysodeixis includens TaxID=689277 RepID=A0A9N8PWS8_CHRIL|nr:unnamed protein product [Chrysodeixis includens]
MISSGFIYTNLESRLAELRTMPAASPHGPFVGQGDFFSFFPPDLRSGSASESGGSSTVQGQIDLGFVRHGHESAGNGGGLFLRQALQSLSLSLIVLVIVFTSTPTDL